MRRHRAPVRAGAALRRFGLGATDFRGDPQSDARACRSRAAKQELTSFRGNKYFDTIPRIDGRLRDTFYGHTNRGPAPARRFGAFRAKTLATSRQVAGITASGRVGQGRRLE